MGHVSGTVWWFLASQAAVCLVCTIGGTLYGSPGLSVVEAFISLRAQPVAELDIYSVSSLRARCNN